jgi:predicted ribosome quality control (RQC) complex YloA/Tae2 family protein
MIDLINKRELLLSSLKIKNIMTSIDLIVITKELRKSIINSRIENIYQITPFLFLFKIRPKNMLIVEAGKRIHLTQYVSSLPPSPPFFCRILRKSLRRGIIQDIQLETFERIIFILILSKGILYKLIIELFGKGNIILVDNMDKILHALSYRRMRDRNILRGEDYKLPPPRGFNPLKVTQIQLMNLRDTKSTVIKALTKLLSIDGFSAEEILLKSGIKKTRASQTLTKSEIKRIYSELYNLALKLDSVVQPNIVFDNTGAFINVLPFPLSIYTSLKMQSYASFNEAVDEYFTKLFVDVKDEDRSNKTTQRIEEQIRILRQQQARLSELRKNIENYQQIGDLIYSHTTSLQKILQEIIQKRERGKTWDETISSFLEKRSKEVATPYFVDSIDAKRGMVKIKIETVSLDLSLRKSIYDNASSYYGKVKEAKGKVTGLKKAIAATEKQIKELKKTKLLVESQLLTPVKARNRFWFEKFHWVDSSDGHLIIGGRDATTNEILIKKHTTTNDLILHAEIAGAPFVIIKANGKFPSKTTIFEAAQLAVAYSRAWRESLTSLDVYWVHQDQVSKTAPTGEYLSKGMFMIRGLRNYIRNVPVQISVGVIEKDHQLMIIGGPTSAIASQTQCMLSIVPGRETSARVAKELRYKLSEKAPISLREKILKISIEEIQRFIPPGKSEFL